MAEIVIMLVQGGTTSAIHAARLLHDLYTELWGGMAPDALEVEATACSLLEEGAIYGMIAYDGKVPVGVIMMAPRAATSMPTESSQEITALYVRLRRQLTAPVPEISPKSGSSGEASEKNGLGLSGSKILRHVVSARMCTAGVEVSDVLNQNMKTHRGLWFLRAGLQQKPWPRLECLARARLTFDGPIWRSISLAASGIQNCSNLFWSGGT